MQNTPTPCRPATPPSPLHHPWRFCYTASPYTASPPYRIATAPSTASPPYGITATRPHHHTVHSAGATVSPLHSITATRHHHHAVHSIAATPPHPRQAHAHAHAHSTRLCTTSIGGRLVMPAQQWACALLERARWHHRGAYMSINRRDRKHQTRSRRGYLGCTCEQPLYTCWILVAGRSPYRANSLADWRRRGLFIPGDSGSCVQASNENIFVTKLGVIRSSGRHKRQNGA